ncbi:MAG: alginate export family protein [Acidobacteriota bacterium]
MLRRIQPGIRAWLFLILALGVGIAHFAPGASAEEADQEVLDPQEQEVSFRWHFQAGLNMAAEWDLFWNLAETFAPDSGFDTDAQWLEGYVKPGVSFERQLDSGATFYGKLSAVGSYTLGIDAFDTGDTGDVTLEELHLGLRGGDAEGLSWDVSLGPRELKLGTGMLISNGASSGFERGALKFGPRKAWERAIIARLAGSGTSGTLFFVDPNERPATDGDNELAGFDLRHDVSQQQYLGVTYVNVLNSTSAYPRAAPEGLGAPEVIPGAREGLNTLNVYGSAKPFRGSLETVFLAAELAHQWNDENGLDLEAWGGRVQAGFTWKDAAWTPTLIYGYQFFSGDDPETATLERFDPLYYEGSPSAWSTGSKSSMTFINSNVIAHSLTLRLQPTQRDTLTLRYAHIRADELRSPIQFGQATRLDVVGATGNVVSGVTDAELSDDIFVEYNRIINRNTYLTAGAAISLPGKGIETTVVGDTPDWTGVFINIVVNY